MAADPVIAQALGELPGGSILLECPVIREDYRKADYPYRTHPAIKLKCVPTLFKWGKLGPAGSLDDNQSQSIDLVRELMSE